MAQYPIFPREGGSQSVLNITAATVVKAAPGTLWRITVTTAGTTAGTASDVLTTGGVAAANLIAEIPNTVGVIELVWPCKTGIVITPGTGQVVSVSFA